MHFLLVNFVWVLLVVPFLVLLVTGVKQSNLLILRLGLYLSIVVLAAVLIC